MFKTIKVQIKGITPTVQHNGQLADPLNKWSKMIKEVTGKRKKTEEDLAELQRLEWFGGLYIEDGKIGWPGDNIEALIRSAAKMSKQGKDVQRGLLCDGFAPLEYEGPRDLDALFADDRFRMVNSVRVGASRVMRTRPQFPIWSLSFDLLYLADQLNEKDIRGFLDTAGTYVGLSDRRPKWGRFEVVKFEA
jgi:hypothetical protein